MKSNLCVFRCFRWVIKSRRKTELSRFHHGKTHLWKIGIRKVPDFAVAVRLCNFSPRRRKLSKIYKGKFRCGKESSSLGQVATVIFHHSEEFVFAVATTGFLKTLNLIWWTSPQRSLLYINAHFMFFIFHATLQTHLRGNFFHFQSWSFPVNFHHFF